MYFGIDAMVPFAACVGYLVLMALAARYGLDRRINQLFIWYISMLMMWSFCSFMIHSNPANPVIHYLAWNKFAIVCGVFSSVALFHFVRDFLGKSQPRLRLSLGYGLCALFALLTIMGYTVKSSFYIDGVFYQEFGLATWAAVPIIFAFPAMAMFDLLRAYRKERDPYARNRIAYPLVGIPVATVLLLSNAVPEGRWYPIDDIGNLICAATVAYAMLRYRLFDISVVFRSALSYVLQTLILAEVLLLLGIAWLDAQEAVYILDLGTALGIPLLIALIFPILLRFVRERVRRIFAGEYSSYRNMLRSTSSALSAMPDLERQASWLIDNVMRTVDVAKGGLFLLDEEQKRYLPRALRGYDNPEMSQMHLESDNPAVAFLAKADQCLTAEDLEQVPQPRAVWKLEWEQLDEMDTRVLVPVKVKDSLIGVILLGPKRSRKRYSVEDLEFIYTVANQAAVAIDNTRLYQEVKDRAEWIDMTSRLTRVIGSSLDINQVYETFTAGLKKLVDFNRISIGLVDGDELRFLAVYSDVPTELDVGATIPLKKSVAAWVIAHKSTNIEDDFVQERRFPVDEIHLRDGLRSAIRLPLFSKGEVFGTLNLSSCRPNAYGERERKILEQIAGQVAVAVQNVLLYEDAKRAYEGARQAYEELSAAQEYMVRSEKLRALGEMAGGVAHDFNNVLTVILGRTQLALEDVEDPGLKKSLRVVERAALNAATTVRRLQEFTRVRTDRAFEQVDVSHLVRSALRMVEPRLKESREREGVDIKVSTDLSAVDSVRGDTAELSEALINIIFNSMDAMPEGGKIDIKAWQEDNQVILSVADNGAGIPDELKAKIFDPFFTTKARKGVGLGLSVAYGIITRHGGNIEVESSVGMGSTFYVRLPLGGEEMKSASASGSVDYTGKAKILLVDDDAEVSEVLELMLGQIGNEVTVVTQGQEAIDMFERDGYDLVITDLGMPDVSGWEVVKAVKQRSPETPVVIITGWGVQIDGEEISGSGVDGIIPKPFSKKTVSDEIARLLEDAK